MPETQITQDNFLHPDSPDVDDPIEKISQEISGRLHDTDLMRPYDAQIASGFLTLILTKPNSTGAETSLKIEALKALDSLVPRWAVASDGHRFRQIADKFVNPAIESLISSRETADIVEFSLSELPEEVQEALREHAVMVVEATDTCTGGCTFCPVADIGKVGSKFSENTIQDLMQLNRKPKGSTYLKENVFSAFYNNTDVADWLIVNPDGTIADITSLLDQYRENVLKAPDDKTKYVPIESSTTLPIGSELRILHTAQSLRTHQDAAWIRVGRLRISNTSRNEIRGKAIISIISYLNGKDEFLQVHMTERDDDFYSISGRGNIDWEAVSARMSLSEIMHIECADKTVFSPFGIRNEFGVAMTNESTRAVHVDEFKRELPDGSYEYRVMHHKLYQAVKATFDKSDTDIDPDFPNPKVTVLKYSKDGEFIGSREETIQNNPQRELFKLCHYLSYPVQIIAEKHDGWSVSHMYNIISDARVKPIQLNQEFSDLLNSDTLPNPKIIQRMKKITESAKVIRKHLDSGNNNPVMKMVLTKIAPIISYMEKFELNKSTPPMSKTVI
jgi:hypothetical protein